jgi:HK97 gp10 family phage protein
VTRTLFFSNAQRFKRKLSYLPKVVAQACKEAMEEGAQEIVEAMRNLVPVQSGALRESIGWCWGDPPKGSARIVAFGRSGKEASGNEIKISIYAGNDDAYYARWVEFGTHERGPGTYKDESGHKRDAGAIGHHATAAHPFFFPVWRAYKRRLHSRITRKVNAAIKQLAKSQNGN